MTSRARSGAVAVLVATVLSTVLAACGGPSADNKYGLATPGTIEAAAATEQPPFSIAGENGHPAGFVIDITDEAARRLNLKVTYKASTTAAMLQGLTSGQYDLAAGGLGVTAEREKSVSFTKALYWSTTAVLTKTDSAAAALTDFSGKKVGAVTGAVQQAFVRDKMPGAIPTSFQSQNTMVSQLVAGNLDGLAVGGPDAREYLKQYPSLRIAVSAPVDHPTAMALPHNHDALRQAIDEQVGAMVSDGTFLTLYRKWFTEPPNAELIKIWPAIGNQVGQR
jgi:polar amino acid transport system substrate-binding protein